MVGLQVRSNGALGGAITADEAQRAPALGGVTAWPAGRELLELREQAVRKAGSLMPNLGPPVLAMSGPQVQLTGGPDRRIGGRLLYRDGFEGQIRTLDAAPGAGGVWLPSEAAAQLGARPGDRITVSLTGRSAPVRVAGTYRELHRSPPTPYWCSLAERIYPPGFAEDPPPPLLLADRATFTAISRRLQETRLEFSWDLELADGVTLARAKDTVAGYEAARRAVAADGDGLIPPEQAAAFNSPGVVVTASQLPFLVQRSEAIVAAVSGAIGPVAVAGTGVALLLVAAAGSYWVDRRRVEVALLAARGVGPPAIAAKAILEMALWVVLGGLLGWLAAIGLVRLLGPSDLLDPAAAPAALARTGVAVAAGLALLGLVAGVRSRGMTERGIGIRPGLAAKCRGSWACSPWPAWSTSASPARARRWPPAPGRPASTCCCSPSRCCSWSAPSPWPSASSGWSWAGCGPPGRPGRTPCTWPPAGSPTAPAWPCCWWPHRPCPSG